MPHAFLCDFDGTVSPRDIGAALVRAHSTGRERERREILERWKAGDIGHRELTEAECRLVRVSRADALTFIADFHLDPAFPDFARAARERGDAVMIVSEGFDFYVADRLERVGLGDLPVAANRVRFVEGGLVPEFPFAGDGCGACGNCKGRHVRDWRSRGYHTVLVGDGLSDRCGARAADTVLARGSLLDWCGREGLEATPFDTFADVLRIASDLWARGPRV